MTRDYTTPVFHLERATADQMRTMETVFNVLIGSDISFAVVYRSDKRKDELYIKSFGYIPLGEKTEIFSEVVQMYKDGDEINHISMV